MFTPFKNGLAAIALALFGGGLAIIPDHRSLGLLFCKSGVGLGVIVVVMAVFSERRFIRNVKNLGDMLVEAGELLNRAVADQNAYDKWKADPNSWYRQCNDTIAKELSPTHAALFRDTSQGGRYGVRGFNGEHMDYKNSLLKYTSNLKNITDRYLTTRN
jgi:hypothetical protein